MSVRVIPRTNRGDAYSALILLSDSDLATKHRLLAYEDGYADGREYGKDGYFVPETYDADASEVYMRGFVAGCRVHKVRWNS